MASLRTVLLVDAALVAFAANSLLCRAALSTGRTDPAAFTAIRIGSGAVALAAIARAAGVRLSAGRRGTAARALALFAYAALFAWAYVRVPAGVGALVLFGCVQLTLVAAAARAGQRPRGRAAAGIALAMLGLAALTLPGLGEGRSAAPDAAGVALMAGAGVAWGLYTWFGRGGGSPLATTANAFVVALAPAALALGAAAALGAVRADARGAWCAVTSGAVTSAGGYALWYAALPALDAGRAAVVQTAVPVLAAAAGVAFLGETAGLRLVLAGVCVLAGIVLVATAPRGGVTSNAR